MTPSKYAKSKGLQGGLKTMEIESGVSVDTLRNWFYNKPKLFELVLEACLNRQGVE